MKFCSKRVLLFIILDCCSDWLFCYVKPTYLFLTVPICIGWPPVCGYFGILLQLKLKLTPWSPSWDAGSPSANKKFPTFYRTWWFITHLQEPVTCCILSQINPVHTFSSCALMSHFNIILPPMPGYSKWSLSHRFSHQNPGCTCPLHVCSISCLSHSSWFHHPNNVWWDHEAPHHAVFYASC